MDPAVITLLILTGCIVLFLTNWFPSAATAVLGCALFALTGVCSFSQAFSGFSSTTTIMVAGMLVIGDAMLQSGLAAALSSVIMRAGAGSERRFITAGILLSAVLSAFMANMAVIAMYLAIVNTVSKGSAHMHLKRLCMPIAMAAMFGGVCTLMGSTPQLQVQNLLEGTCGLSLRPFDYMPVGVILTLAFLAYVHILWYPLSRKLWKDGEEAGVDQKKLDSYCIRQGTGGTGTDKRIIMGLIMALVIVLFITEAVNVAMAAVIGALLCLVTGCTTERSVLKNMDWAVLIRLAGCLGLAAGIGESGCDELIASALISVFGAEIHPMALLLAAVSLAVLVSNFISKSTAVIIVLTPVLSLCGYMGFNPIPFGLAVCYGANLAFATPLANAQIGVTMIAGYQFQDYFKVNILLEVLVVLVVAVFVPIFFPFYR